jgi:hypothetical protein
MVIIGKRVRSTKGFSSRTILGMLLGWALAFEGFFAFSISNTATIEGIGGIRSSTFLLAAIQLTLIGVFLSISWALKVAMPDSEKGLWGKLIGILTYLGTAMVVIEGLIIVFMAGDIFVTGFGGISKKFIVLTGAQLFALGMLSLRLWRLRNVEPTNWLMDVLGSIAVSMFMIEGLTVMGIAARTDIQGLGTILETSVFIAGAQLFLLGALLFTIWTIGHDPWLGPRVNKLLTERRAFILVTIIGGIIAIEGLVASTMAGLIAIENIGGARKIIVVAGCAQLFALGILAPLLWKLRLYKLDKKFIPEFVSPLAMIILATEGIVAIGLSAITHIDGIGSILKSTFLMAGEQLLILSLIGLFAFMLKNSPLIEKWPKRLVNSILILSIGLVGLEGIIAVALAANIYINDFSGVGERYVLLGGVQMAIIAMIALTFWARSEGITIKFKVTATGAAAFMVLMLPIALLI